MFLQSSSVSGLYSRMTVQSFEPILKEPGTYPKEGQVNYPLGAKKRSMERLCGEWTASPTPFFEQALEILSSRSHECLTVDSPEPTEAKTAHTMPVFALCK